MNLIVKAKYFLLRSAVLFAVCFLLTAFISRSNKKTFLNTDTIVNVMQENSGLTVSVKTSKKYQCAFLHVYRRRKAGKGIKYLWIKKNKHHTIGKRHLHL